jgi:citrate synthase
MEHAFDVAMTLHADHELNASTFAARVTAATLSDIYSSVTSGIGALKGPLHGGANQDVINWLLNWETKMPRWTRVKNTLARKVKIPGFGHRVYRTEDPRATHLRVLSEELGKRTGHEKLYRLSKTHGRDHQIDQGAPAQRGFLFGFGLLFARHPDRSVHADFRGEPHGGLDRARAGTIPQQPPDSPAAEYKGNPDGQTWIPIAER